MPLRVLLACALAILVGCGRSPSSTAVPAAEGGGAGTSAAGPDAVQMAAALAELTQAVRKYAAEQQRAPKTLEELVPKGYLSQVPVAPPGKRFAIDKKLQVDLVSQ